MYNEVLEVLNIGIVILDSQYTVLEWNRWMEIHSKISKKDIEGTILFHYYPHLSNPSFLRGCKSVLKFGNYVYFSQKLHNYLFPFKASGIYARYYDFMQQSCTMTPIKGEDGRPERIVLTIQNVTESVFLEKKLKMMTQQDSLTGIYNRRFLDVRLEEEFKRFIRSGMVFTLLMIDIDNFKDVNDNYGHQFGDEVLKAIACCCKDIVRGSDIVARFGGEEFSIALMDSSLKGAVSFAERLRKKIENTTVTSETNDSVFVTVSIGVASVEESMTSFEQIIGNADRALYSSKRNGKNNVTVFNPDLHEKRSRN
jgi:diguanylate cyclase (GGDEF)-like protein